MSHATKDQPTLWLRPQRGGSTPARSDDVRGRRETASTHSMTALGNPRIQILVAGHKGVGLPRDRVRRFWVSNHLEKCSNTDFSRARVAFLSLRTTVPLRF